MEAEHKSYLAERIILYPALLFISFLFDDARRPAITDAQFTLQ